MKIIREELSKYGIILLDEKKDIKEILLDSMVNGNIPDDVCKKMWVEYKERRKDSYEFVADMTPRSFGKYFEKFIIEKNKKYLSKNTHSLEYDVDSIDGYKIEVKSSRIFKKGDKKDKQTADRLLYFSDCAGDETINFQQIKPKLCDYFVFVAVYYDRVRCWVVENEVVEELFNRQHRGGDNTEGQVNIIPNKFKRYECEIDNIENKISNNEKYKRNNEALW